jgi:hypothetical protein
VTARELAEIPVDFEDGRHDDWASAPPELAYL